MYFIYQELSVCDWDKMVRCFNNHLFMNDFFAEDAPLLNGFDVLNKFFDELFTTNSKVVAFGEDLGFIGDVNQGFSVC